MRKIYLSLIALALSYTGMAQTTIGNPGFELWENVGSNTEEPLQWNSNRTGGGFATSGPKTCSRDVNPHSGTYCAKITSGTAFFTVVNGSLTTGKVEAPSTTKSEGYIDARPYDSDTSYRMRFTGRPDSIVFWIKYTPKSGSNDGPRVEARLHTGNAYAPEAPVGSNHPDSTVNIIARAAYLGTPGATISSWTRISLPFTYVDGRTPKYILITSTSSADQSNGSDGSSMWLDDFEAIYNPTVATGNPDTGPYYVNATAGATIKVPFALTGNYGAGNTVSALLSDASGTFAPGTNIGSKSSTVSDSVAGTIPAGTATGTGYKVKVSTSTPVLNAAASTTAIQVVLTTASIAPATAQTIEAGNTGTLLTATKTAGGTSSEWKYSSTAGGPYTSFSPAQTGSTYTPTFATAGTYYVVNETQYTNPLNTITTRSNEVQINAVSNSIAPASPQSLLTSVAGTTLTVTESSPATNRFWKYATVSGGTLTNLTGQTGTTYTPIFGTAGTYYVVCQSVISGVTVTSNEVIISVGSVTLNTTAVTGFPIDFSPSAPNKAVTVSYTVAGGSFISGNTFTAQLSDATGAFTSPTNIGSVSSTTNGTINATVPHTTPGGTGYRVRVIASTPAIQGGDNGADLIIDQFSNSVSSAATQTIAYNTGGNFLNVTESQNASRVWKYSTTAGGTFTAFNPAETSPSYIPFFAVPDTYYVAAFSKNQYNDEVKSNEVTIIVTNGTTLTTGAIAGSPFLVSPKANVQVTVPFTSNIIFDPANVFTAQLSDAAGSFASPLTIGTLNGATVGSINAVIPNNTNAGTAYRIRVVSSNPAATGTDNGTDLEVIPFEISATPNDTAFLTKNVPGGTIVLNSTHPAIYTWLYTSVSGLGYTDFSPVETNDAINPTLGFTGRFFLTCMVVNAVNDTLTLPDIVMIVKNAVGIDEAEKSFIRTYFSGNELLVDATQATLDNASIELYDVSGRKILGDKLKSGTVNRFAVNLPAGNYLYAIKDGGDEIKGKASKK
jgi:plastocyanin